MHFDFAYSFIAILLSFCICVYSWKRPEVRGSKEFALMCLTAMLWMSGIELEKLSNNFTQQYIAATIRFLGVIPLPVVLFLFKRRYAGRKVKREQIIKLSIVPCLSFILMITSIWQNVFFSIVNFASGKTLDLQYGIYFWLIHTPYSYLLILISIFLILYELTVTTQKFRSQIALLFLSMCFPLLVNIAYLAGFLQGINLMPVSFLGFMTVSTIGIFRFQFLNSSPIAYETVFKTSQDGVILIDQNNFIADINPAALKGFKMKAQDMIGKKIDDILSPYVQLWSKHKDDLKAGKDFEMELDDEKSFFSVSTIPIDNGNGIIGGKILTIRNITTHKHHQHTLETLAFHDPLTRLANRRKFQEEFAKTTKNSEKTGENFAILYFDLNKFKLVNDKLGHEIGDELLKYVAARIASILRTPDILARIGGDEFAAILHNANEKGVEIAVNRIIQNTQRPFKVKDHILSAELSVGAAFYPEDGTNLVQLLRFADAAMYRAKTKGGGLAVFNPKVDNTSVLNM